MQVVEGAEVVEHGSMRLLRGCLFVCSIKSKLRWAPKKPKKAHRVCFISVVKRQKLTFRTAGNHAGKIGFFLRVGVCRYILQNRDFPDTAPCRYDFWAHGAPQEEGSG